MQLIERLRVNKIIIYGASISAQNMSFLLKKSGIIPSAFCVSEKDDLCENEIDGIKILDAKTVVDLYPNAFYLVACRREHYAEIELFLKKNGITKYMFSGLESDIDKFLRKKYYGERFKFEKEQNSEEICARNIFVYMVRCHKDKETSENFKEEYLHVIQAGAAITKEIISDIRDNIGDNISLRNNNYSECTAIYWMWKNVKHDYMGICHYRRLYQLKYEQIARLFESGVDIIIPYPGLYSPCVKTAYINSVPKIKYMNEDWDMMIKYIIKLYPAYEDFVINYEKNRDFLHYNMMIARYDIFCEWCEFMFDILFSIENEYKKKNIERDDRYLGYLAEVLTTIFVFKNMNRWNIAPVDIIFVET